MKGWPFLKYRVRRKGKDKEEVELPSPTLKATWAGAGTRPNEAAAVAAPPVREREAYPVRRVVSRA